MLGFNGVAISAMLLHEQAVNTENTQLEQHVRFVVCIDAH